MRGAPAMVGAMDHIGQLVRIHAEEIAPVDTGAYAFGVEAGNGAHDGGFTVDAGLDRGIARVRVVNAVRSAPSKRWPQGYAYGVALEFGNGRMRGQRILGRALDAVNLA
jgi:hypothetical protein